MTLTDDQMKRLEDRVSVIASSRSTNKREYEVARNAILAALYDPALTKEIENAAYERAARVCEENANNYREDFAWIPLHCAAAIRALIKESK